MAFSFLFIPLCIFQIIMQKIISEVIELQYDNLQSLIRNSSSTRNYFLSLPVDMQLELHKHNEYIHSAQQLHNLAYSIKNMNNKSAKIFEKRL